MLSLTILFLTVENGKVIVANREGGLKLSLKLRAPKAERKQFFNRLRCWSVHEYSMDQTYCMQMSAYYQSRLQ